MTKTIESKFKIKDRVVASPMWKFDSVSGEVIKINKEYVVVKWDNVPGEWHYTHEKACTKLKKESGSGQ
jgi:hypothetical protein